MVAKASGERTESLPTDKTRSWSWDNASVRVKVMVRFRVMVGIRYSVRQVFCPAFKASSVYIGAV